MNKSQERVLIIVDLQKGFVNDKSKPVLSVVEKLVDEVRFNEIIATKFVNKEHSFWIEKLNYEFMQNSEETGLALNLNRFDNVKIIEKTSYGVPKKYLNGFSKDLKNKQVYICGLDYDACVLAIGFQLFDAKVDFKFILDGIGSFSSRSQSIEQVQKHFKRIFGEDCFVTSNDLLESND